MSQKHGVPRPVQTKSEVSQDMASVDDGQLSLQGEIPCEDKQLKCVCLNQVEVSISYRPGHFMQSLFRQLLIFFILDQSISSNAVEATS